MEKQDTNCYLIGFENGVYDLKEHTFTPGKQDDMVTMSTGYNFAPEKSENYDSLLQFLEDIQPNKVERDYLLTFLSTALFGNSLKLFTILTGKGCNGKTTLIELLKMTFGDYYGSIDSQFLTEPKPNNFSSADVLLHLHCKKLVTSSEPNGGQKLSIGHIKQISSNDTILVKPRYQKDIITFDPNFVTLFICNNIPKTDNCESSFMRRLRCINFPTEFCDNPVKDYQKQINTNINENFNSWRNDFMLLLLEFYKKYQEEGKLEATDEILKWNKKYEKENNIYMRFFDEAPEEIEGEKIEMGNIYNSFKKWFNDNNYGRLPDKRNAIYGLKLAMKK